MHSIRIKIKIYDLKRSLMWNSRRDWLVQFYSMLACQSNGWFLEADRTAGGSRAFHLLPKFPRTHRRMQQVPTNAKLFEWEVHRRQCHFPSSDGSFYISIASQATAISAPQSQNKWCINNSGWMPRTLRDVSMSISSIIHTTEWSGENYRSQWCAIVLWKRDKET